MHKPTTFNLTNTYIDFDWKQIFIVICIAVGGTGGV